MEDKKTILEIYKMYVQTAEKVSDRRLKSNSFYLTLSTSILTALLVMLKLDILDITTYIFISIIGVLLSIVWFYNIQSYKQLNTGKFKVIHDIEKQLPYPCFEKEWKYLGHIEKEKRLYRLLTTVEKFVPIIFIVGFIALIVMVIFDVI